MEDPFTSTHFDLSDISKCLSDIIKDEKEKKK